MEYLKAKEQPRARPEPLQARMPGGADRGAIARLPKPGGWLHFETGWLSTEATLRNLETIISLLQTTNASLITIDETLMDALEVIQAAWRTGDRTEPPPVELKRLIGRRLRAMDETVRNCTFHGRGLLDGQSGVVGWGRGVVFVRGGPHTLASPPEGYPVTITGIPSRATMTGGVAVHESWLRDEQEIFLAEGDRYMRFQCLENPTVEDFVTDLQQSVRAAGLDLEVGLTRNRRLMVRHGQYGSQFKFKGCSRQTPLLAKRPGKLEWSRRGQDIKGSLAGEPAFGIGRLLIGYLDNPETSELSVLWPGPAAMEESDPRVFVVQNGLNFKDREQEDSDTKICLPALYSHQVGRWMETGSAYGALRNVRFETWQEVSDSLHMIYAVVSEIDDWEERMKRWIKRYQNRAMVYLRRGLPLSGIEPGEGFTGSEIQEMAGALKRKIEQEG